MGAQRVIADRYSLVESLSGSDAGLGWQARDQWSDQSVVIMRVPVSRLVGAELLRARQEIAREVRVLGGLRHDRLVVPVDVVVDEGDLWVVSEPLPGVTMADELTRRGVVGALEVARWGRDVAEGLAAVHAVGVLHRNLHAGVVGVAGDGRAVVGGFATTAVTPEGQGSGVPVHVAPEVARGAPPSPASDVFALGAMLYQAVEGQELFPSAVRDDPVRPPQRAGLFKDPLMRMLHPDPAQRPAAAAVADQLRPLCAAPGGSAGAALKSGPPARVPIVPEQRGAGWSPTATDPAAQQTGIRIRWVIVAAVVVVLALAGALLVAFQPWTTGPLGLPAATPPPTSPIGDPRTVDPCSLLTTNSVQRFGSATMYRDIGFPHECLIEIATAGSGGVHLTVVFALAKDRDPPGVPERYGALTVFQETAGATMCSRTVILGDRSRVYVTATPYKGATADLCAIADAGTQTTVAALSSGSLPRRDIGDPPHGLTGLDTCSLLDQAALGQVPGLDASRRQRGFAGWLCLWGDNPAFAFTPWARAVVARRLPLSGQPVQIGGRSAQVLPGGADDPGSCEVDLVQRSYTGSSGDPRVELLEISVHLGAQQSTDMACRSARALTEAAVPKLPPAS